MSSDPPGASAGWSLPSGYRFCTGLFFFFLFFVLTPELWKALPKEVQRAPVLSTFQKKCKGVFELFAVESLAHIFIRRVLFRGDVAKLCFHLFLNKRLSVTCSHIFLHATLSNHHHYKRHYVNTLWLLSRASQWENVWLILKCIYRLLDCFWVQFKVLIMTSEYFAAWDHSYLKDHMSPYIMMHQLRSTRSSPSGCFPTQGCSLGIH